MRKRLKLRALIVEESLMFPSSKPNLLCLDLLKSFLSVKNRYIFVLKSDQGHYDRQLLEETLGGDSKRIVDHCGLNIEEIRSYVGAFDLQKEEIFSCGQSPNAIELNQLACLHFHLGRSEALIKKYRNVVPMSEQNIDGFNNLLLYFDKRKYTDSPLAYRNMIGFIQNSINFYERDTAGKEVLDKHNKAVVELFRAFPDDIVAIFGTGYPHYMLVDDPISSSISSPHFFVEQVGVSADQQTPASINKYLKTQMRYYSGKIISEDIFFSNFDQLMDTEQLKDLFGISIERNEFDEYKYTKMGHSCPEELMPKGHLSYYYDNACFEIESDIWPCFYCSTLQTPDLFPNQSVLKDTNINCLSCKQTSFMLRTITSCCTDIDVVVVVKENKDSCAAKIKEFLRNSKEFYIYDAEFTRMAINENDGPTDIFVTEKKDFCGCFSQLLLGDWPRACFNSIALWSLTLNDHAFNIGEDFALAFEPRLIADEELYAKFLEIRKKFALAHKGKDVVEKLRHYSQPREQILSNKEIVDRILLRLERWKHIELPQELHSIRKEIISI